MHKLAPVALFGYNRVDHLEQTVKHLKANDRAGATDVYLFLDGSPNAAADAGVAQVRKFAKGIKGFRSTELIERNRNVGLRRSIIDGVTQVAKEHGRVIVLEDDIVTSQVFLRYMNGALDFYSGYRTVGSISGYVAGYVAKQAGLKPEDSFFHYRTNSWGWATWWDRWQYVDWKATSWQQMVGSAQRQRLFARGGGDLLPMLRNSMEGRNQSWLARWYYHCFVHGMLTLYPGHSLVDNIGYDGSGTHSRTANASAYLRYRTPLKPPVAEDFNYALPVQVDEQIHVAMKRFWDPPWFPSSALARALRPIYRQVCKRRGRHQE